MAHRPSPSSDALTRLTPRHHRRTAGDDHHVLSALDMDRSSRDIYHHFYGSGGRISEEDEMSYRAKCYLIALEFSACVWAVIGLTAWFYVRQLI